MRTVLRRLAEEAFVRHTAKGRTYHHSPTLASRNVAADAVSGNIERFRNGSVEDLFVGMGVKTV